MWIFADEKIAAWIAASEKGGFSHRIPTKFLLYLLNVFEKIPKKLHLYLFFQKLSLPLRSTSQKTGVGEIKFDIGEMAEWSNAAVLKTVDLNGSGGSNPSLSANKLKLSALRWAFFVQNRQELAPVRPCTGKAPKAVRTLSFNLFSTAPPRRR